MRVLGTEVSFTLLFLYFYFYFLPSMPYYSKQKNGLGDFGVWVADVTCAYRHGGMDSCWNYKTLLDSGNFFKVDFFLEIFKVEYR